ncbi:SGNH/GDSL hydrolase family protein [Streptomyces griseosporeus]|uniref:SGNH/GDSL hydrolase family protein n=1 Tax=Streptomyces griseosporeus TaxID=1910 RepID=UPI00369DEF09
MKRASSLVGLTVTAAVAAACAVVPATLVATRGEPSRAPGLSAPAAANAHWVHTWSAMPQLTEPGNMPPAPFTGTDRVLDHTTLRQTVHLSLGGERIRLRFSNAFGGTSLPITGVSVALPAGGRAGVSAVVPGSNRTVTFGGQPGIEIPKGAQAVSDPLDLDVPPGGNLTVTLYLERGQASTDITSHPGSRTTSYLIDGNHLDDQELTGATPVDHWYFLSGVETLARRPASATVLLGDSLTDGRGSTTNGNDRWPDQLLTRLQADRGTAGVALVNEAAGGNRVLRDGLGPNALARLDRDVLATSGVDRLLVFEGVNDIGTAEATPAAMRQITAELVGAYRQIVTRAHAQGISVYGATLTPLTGHAYDDPDGLRESARQAVNRWIRTSGTFDAVVDFDATVRDPQDPRRLLPAYDTGDHLHLNPAGYRALAQAVPLGLFRGQPR